MRENPENISPEKEAISEANPQPSLTIPENSDNNLPDFDLDLDPSDTDLAKIETADNEDTAKAELLAEIKSEDPKTEAKRDKSPFDIMMSEISKFKLLTKPQEQFWGRKVEAMMMVDNLDELEELRATKKIMEQQPQTREEPREKWGKQEASILRKQEKWVTETMARMKETQDQYGDQTEVTALEEILEKGISEVDESTTTIIKKITTAGKPAREIMIQSSLRLVVSIAKKYYPNQMGIEDLIQEGNIGLIKAVEKFQPERDFKFSTYATWWIRQAIARAIGDQDETIRVPINLRGLRKTELKIQGEIKNESPVTGYHDQMEIIAERMGIPLEKTKKIWEAPEPTDSLQRLAEGETDGVSGNKRTTDIIPDQNIWGDKPPSPEDQIITANTQEIVSKILVEKLTPREFRILELYYGLNGKGEHTLEQIGTIFGLSRERIRQIKSRAERKVRHPFIAKSPQIQEILGITTAREPRLRKAEAAQIKQRDEEIWQKWLAGEHKETLSRKFGFGAVSIDFILKRKLGQMNPVEKAELMIARNKQESAIITARNMRARGETETSETQRAKDLADIRRETVARKEAEARESKVKRADRKDIREFFKGDDDKPKISKLTITELLKQMEEKEEK